MSLLCSQPTSRGWRQQDEVETELGFARGTFLRLFQSIGGLGTSEREEVKARLRAAGLHRLRVATRPRRVFWVAFAGEGRTKPATPEDAVV